MGSVFLASKDNLTPWLPIGQTGRLDDGTWRWSMIDAKLGFMTGIEPSSEFAVKAIEDHLRD